MGKNRHVFTRQLSQLKRDLKNKKNIDGALEALNQKIQQLMVYQTFMQVSEPIWTMMVPKLLIT